jgi:hypothetical protein
MDTANLPRSRKPRNCAAPDRIAAPRRRTRPAAARLPRAAVARSRTAVKPLLVFTARAEARAILYGACVMDLHTAVDGLWASAEAERLLDEVGADALQAILATAFGAVR